MSTQEHHATMSELGFTVRDEHLPYLNEYHGDWSFSGAGELPNNHWVVTFDGMGHPISGHLSPQQMLDEAMGRGWDCAYVAPYGRHVIGEEDGVQLHDWLKQRRLMHRHERHQSGDRKDDFR